jgi:hypothetical protein
LSKHDTLSIAPVANQNVSKGRNPVLEWTTDGKMLHVSGRLVFQILAQVNDSEIFLHVRTCHVSYPPWDSGREETNLNIIFALLVDSHQNLKKVKTQFILTRSTSSLKPSLSI